MGYAAISRQIVSGLSLIVGHPADVVELLDVWKTHTFGVRSVMNREIVVHYILTQKLNFLWENENLLDMAHKPATPPGWS